MQLFVNGKSYEVETDPSTPLLWVLRDLLKLKGTKFGCGMAQCGACTVHLNGKAVRSCQITMDVIGEQEITTIEGLSENGDHPIQLAWQEYSVPQCGYCQPGQMMNAAALLKENPAPSDTEIEQGMSGNICRCGTYNRINKAIKTASKNMKKDQLLRTH